MMTPHSIETSRDQRFLLFPNMFVQPRQPRYHPRSRGEATQTLSDRSPASSHLRTNGKTGTGALTAHAWPEAHRYHDDVAAVEFERDSTKANSSSAGDTLAFR